MSMAPYCPFCGEQLAVHVSSTNPDKAQPQHNDIILCAMCNRLAVWDENEADGLRIPTEEEFAWIAADPNVQEALEQRKVVTDLFERLKKKPSRGGA
jgi:hypothetical protein